MSEPARRRRVVVDAVLGMLLFFASGADPAWARCATRAEVRAFASSVSAVISCGRMGLRGGDGSLCVRAVVPACAGDAVSALTALVFGQSLEPSVTGPDRSAPMRCQRAVAEASRRFVLKRLAERAAGGRRMRHSVRSFRLIERNCVVAAAPKGRAVVPSLGGACASAVVPVGAPVDPEALVACLRPALEAIVDRVGPAPLPPNVLLVLADDQRSDTLPFMPRVMEQLAGRGVTFTDAFVTTPLCAPSRASILTGQRARNTGVSGNFFPHGGARALDASSTIATWLRAAGYRTGLFGKYLNGYDALAPAVPPGWDTWRAFASDARAFYDYTLAEDGELRTYGGEAASYSTDVLRDMALAFIRAHADVPWFVLYAPYAPHDGVPAPRHQGAYAWVPPWRPPSWGDNVSRKPAWVRFWAAFFRRPEQIALRDALNHASLEASLAVDEGAAALLAATAELGLEDNTVVVFTSDHGLLWGEHGWTGKECAYEEAIRVPLVIRYPLLAPVATARDELVLNIDLAPTLADLADAPIASSVDGRSVRDLLRGEPAVDWRDDFPIENRGGFVPGNRAVRTRRWKYIETPQGSVTIVELYDLLADPFEMTNLAGDPAVHQIEAALAARLVELHGQ